MNQPASTDRGKTIAQVMSALEMANDMAKRFALGQTFSTRQFRKQYGPTVLRDKL